MKRLKLLAAAASFAMLLGGAAWAEMTTLVGPVSVTQSRGHEENEAKFKFAAPVPGKGVIVIKNGGDVGKKARVSSAKIELNDKRVLGSSDFSKNVDELRVDVDLKAENELEVEVKSCRKCELTVTVLGEKPAPPPPPPPPAPPAPAPAPAPSVPGPLAPPPPPGM